MPDPNTQNARSTPPPRNARRAGIVVVAILLALIIGIFVLRQVWHAEEQQDDPGSVAAPDASYGDGQAPAE